VLVNRGTAGAAEIVASAILENARGDVVGDKTFGDGSVQKTIDLPDGGALILSVAKYYSPSGKAIQDTAVTPNVVVADEENVGPDDEDSGTYDSRAGKAQENAGRPTEQSRRSAEEPAAAKRSHWSKLPSEKAPSRSPEGESRPHTSFVRSSL
jgi:carboxyl-terminal processing protease